MNTSIRNGTGPTREDASTRARRRTPLSSGGSLCHFASSSLYVIEHCICNGLRSPTCATQAYGGQNSPVRLTILTRQSNSTGLSSRVLSRHAHCTLLCAPRECGGWVSDDCEASCRDAVGLSLDSVAQGRTRAESVIACRSQGASRLRVLMSDCWLMSCQLFSLFSVSLSFLALPCLATSLLACLT